MMNSLRYYETLQALKYWMARIRSAKRFFFLNCNNARLHYIQQIMKSLKSTVVTFSHTVTIWQNQIFDYAWNWMKLWKINIFFLSDVEILVCKWIKSKPKSFFLWKWIEHLEIWTAAMMENKLVKKKLLHFDTNFISLSDLTFCFI